MFVKSTRFKQVCQLLLSLIVAASIIYHPDWCVCVCWAGGGGGEGGGLGLGLAQGAKKVIF